MTITKTPLLLFCLLVFDAAVAGAAPSALPLGARELTRLVAPEPQALASEYRARLVTLRLFGTQGEGDKTSATLADTATWATFTYRVGELIGRSLQVTAVRGDAVEITDSVSGNVAVVKVGGELQVRLIEHDFDRAAVDHGQHQLSVRALVLARLLGRYGVGATTSEVALHGQPMQRLSTVSAGSALARLGLREGDLLVGMSVNGAAAAAVTPAALCAALTQPSNQVVMVTLVRGGTRFELSYTVE